MSLKVHSIHFKKIIPAFALSLIMQGCSSIALTPGAEKVIVTRNAAPKSCKFLGTVVGSQGGFFTGAYTSNKNLAAGALNDMRNQGLELGANYIQLETERAGVTGSGYSSNGSGGFGSHQTDVTQTGNAYRCNPADIGLE